MSQVQIITFYKFFTSTPAEVLKIKTDLEALELEFSAHGLFILGEEGINSTFSVAPEKSLEFKSRLTTLLGAGDLLFKDSFAPHHPFHEFKVKLRSEIVTLDRPGLVPKGPNHHVQPEEWERLMNEEDVVVIDTRNSYEYDIGHFKNALDPKTREFNEFPEWLKNSNIPKEKKVLIYCTGGIRCEKAILEMEEQGYQNVFQLEGGILNYLQKLPHRNFAGECFVFDYRVAVDQELNPTKNYRLCPHCGQPAKTKITCIQCGVEEICCDVCLEKGAEFKTCSKNCAHHFRMGHHTKRIHHDAFRKRQSIPGS